MPLPRPLLMLSAALLTCACSRGDTADDVPPLPDQTAETANALMGEAERAAGNAATRAETSAAPTRSIANPVEEEKS